MNCKSGNKCSRMWFDKWKFLRTSALRAAFLAKKNEEKKIVAKLFLCWTLWPSFHLLWQKCAYFMQKYSADPFLLGINSKWRHLKTLQHTLQKNANCVLHTEHYSAIRCKDSCQNNTPTIVKMKTLHTLVIFAALSNRPENVSHTSAPSDEQIAVLSFWFVSRVCRCVCFEVSKWNLPTSGSKKFSLSSGKLIFACSSISFLDVW